MTDTTALIDAAAKAYRTLTDAQSVCRDVRNAFPADDARAEFATKMLAEIMATQRAIHAALNGPDTAADFLADSE